MRSRAATKPQMALSRLGVMPQLSLPKLLVIAAVVVAGGAAIGVTAVSALDANSACDYPVSPGGASALVSAIVNPEAMSEVAFPTPLITTGQEMSVVFPGEGEQAQQGDAIDFDVSVFVGSDGQFLTGSSYDPANPVRRVIDNTGDDFFASVLECQRPGAQVVMTSPIVEVFGSIEGDDYVSNDSTIVLVIDVHQTYPSRAEGSPRLPQSGMPTVVQAPSGEHGLSFPNAPIPTELRVSVLKQGSGPLLADGDVMVANLTAAVWNTRTIFFSSFDIGVPLSLPVTDRSQSAGGEGVVAGLAQALIGQSVGSQILISVPPELGYAPGTAPAGVSDGSTLVYVIDILGLGS